MKSTAKDIGQEAESVNPSLDRRKGRRRSKTVALKRLTREEIRQGIACVKHQNMAGSDMGDEHKE